MDNITDAVLTTDQPEQATIVLLTVDVISCMVQTPDGHLAPSYTISRRAQARPLRIVVTVMADIRAGVEAKTAVEDLLFPRYS